MTTLKSLQLKKVRCFADSGEIAFKRLNIFLGANNTGKSTIMSAVELFYKTVYDQRVRALPDEPMAFQDLPNFRVFKDVAQKTASEECDHFEISYLSESPTQGRKKRWRTSFLISEKPDSGQLHVIEVRIEGVDEKGHLVAKREDPDAPFFTITEPRLTDKEEARISKSVRRMMAAVEKSKKSAFNTKDFKVEVAVSFHRTIPTLLLVMSEKAGKFRAAYPLMGMAPGSEIPDSLKFLESFEASWFNTNDDLKFKTIRPLRPDPRSYYVIDDPYLGPEQVGFIRELLRLSSSSYKSCQAAWEQIQTNVALLGLASKLECAKLNNQVIQVKVGSIDSPDSGLHNIADVGYGVSQILPLLVSEACSKESVLIIYQPEIHLHPFAQSRLADIFTHSVKRSQNKLFVETHSTSLILRLQTLIAKGELDPRDVGVFCVESEAGGCKVSEMIFDKRGVPQQKWPKNFMDTELSLAREMAMARK